MKLKHKQKLSKGKIKQLQQCFNQAIKHHQSGQLQQAKQFYQQVLAISPNHADSLHSLGLIIADEGELQYAKELIDMAIKAQPKFAPYYANRGILHKRMQNKESAVADLCKAIKLEPKMWHAYFNLGDLYAELNQHDKAINAYKKVIQLNPSDKKAHNNIGNVYLVQENHAEAAKCYQKVLELDCNCVEAASNLGVALYGLGKHDEAIKCYQRAMQIDMQHADTYLNWGLVLADLGRMDEALDKYQQALKLNPNNVNLYSNLGNCYKEQQQTKEAMECFTKALELEPNCSEAKFNLAITQLLIGDFSNGWQNYESRFYLKERIKGEYRFPQPEWRGQSLENKTLFIHVEQGLGDTLQFVRYIPLIKADKATIIMESQPELLPLLQDQFKNITNITIVPRTKIPQYFDYHVALMSLPLVFKTDLSSIPYPEGYIKIASSQQTVFNTNYIKKNNKPNVAIVWSGGTLHKNNKNRSIALEEFEPLFKNNINFYSLQFGDRAVDLQHCSFGEQIKDLSPYISNFTDTAKFLSQLDLLITVDTAIAHLAGAMGKNCWILLPYVPDFRWLQHRTDSPWYESIKLFRQQARGDWDKVTEIVAAELKKFMPKKYKQKTKFNVTLRRLCRVFSNNNM